MYYYARTVCQRHTTLSCTFIKGSCYTQLSFHNFYYILRCVLSPTNCHSHVAHDSKNVEDILLTCKMTLGENLNELYGSHCSLPHVEFCFSPYLQMLILDFTKTTLTAIM